MEEEENKSDPLPKDALCYSDTSVPHEKSSVTDRFSNVDRQSSQLVKIYDEGSKQEGIILELTIPECDAPGSPDVKTDEGKRDSGDTELNMDAMIGKMILYYCKVCKLSSLSLGQIQEHVATCFAESLITDKENGLNGQPADQMDHSYANELQNENEDMGRGDTGLADDVSETVEPIRKTVAGYCCAVCPHLSIFSETELSIHSECHKTSGFKNLFTCCLCHSDSGTNRRGRPLSLTADWEKVKTHLTKVHHVNFSLPCVMCSYVCRSHDQLDKHRRQNHLRCKSCNFRTEDPDNFYVHVRCHDTKDTFRCFLCEKCKFPREHDWNVIHDHLVEVHPGSIRPRHVCKKCGQGFQQLNKFYQHYKDCMLKVVCEQCSKSVQVTKLRQHIMELHDKDPLIDPDNNLDQDTVCDMESSTGETETSHQVSPPILQLSKQVLRCYRHKLNFSSENEMEAHFKTEHSRSCMKKKKYSDFLTDLESVKSMQKSVASVPEKAAGTTLENTLSNDDTVDDDNGGDSDDETFKPSSQTGGQKMASGRHHQHKIEVEGEDKVRCKYCYKLFGDQWRLEAHCKRVHTEERMKKVPCTVCGKLFRNQVQRRNHTRQVHEGIKRLQKPSNKPKEYFRCSLCQFATPDKSRLRNHHLAVHQGIMPFTCEFCNYKTKEKSDFRRHKLRHMGVKRHHCPYCPYQCLERWVMVNHCSRQHQVELPRISRNTRGGPYSMHRLRSAAAAANKKPAMAHFMTDCSAINTSDNLNEKLESISNDNPENPSLETYPTDTHDYSDTSQQIIDVADTINVEVSQPHDNVDITEVIVQTDAEGMIDNQVIYIEQPHGDDILQYVLLPCDMEDK
ncbi:hypothetical protein LSH36_302g02030 [Paralvinella palmiformis]|uniref:C2H2-type domain-containing protein n=1 Tax=Paralvinella palmiformis TaxID=53620 RepID=A0AAD9N346_9ANNE|nr:hypothetical protein LSH36_302g02030 [Paralvinella palmiformis]